MEITPREVLVSIVIALISIIIGFVLATNIHDAITTRNDVYFKALKVKDDADTFTYAINTEVGNVLSEGEFVADNPVTDSLIEGKYTAIRKVKEEYTMHTRTVTYSCGKSTCTRQETYWTWDEIDWEVFTTDTLTYLEQSIGYNQLKELDSEYSHKDTVKESIDIRYKLYIIPKKFNGALFANTTGKALSQHELYYNDTVASVVEKREKEADRYTVLFWILWAVFVIAGIFGFYYLDNDWLHKWGK